MIGSLGIGKEWIYRWSWWAFWESHVFFLNSLLPGRIHGTKGKNYMLLPMPKKQQLKNTKWAPTSYKKGFNPHYMLKKKWVTVFFAPHNYVKLFHPMTGRGPSLYFNPFEKYQSNWIISPGFGVKVNMFETTIYILPIGWLYATYHLLREPGVSPLKFVGKYTYS